MLESSSSLSSVIKEEKEDESPSFIERTEPVAGHLSSARASVNKEFFHSNSVGLVSSTRAALVLSSRNSRYFPRRSLGKH